jgi:polysaccharide export outer membrane protein
MPSFAFSWCCRKGQAALVGFTCLLLAADGQTARESGSPEPRDSEATAAAVDASAFRRPRHSLSDEPDEGQVLLCQACEPAEPAGPVYPIWPDPHKEVFYPYHPDQGFQPPVAQEFQTWQQGEYVARARERHVPHYRLRVDDELDFVFRLTREETSRPYQINVGDEIRLESFTDKNLDRSLIVQPDGTITLSLLGQVRATHHTVSQLREEIENLYKRFYKTPAITITPLKVNTQLEDLRATVDSRAGFGGQTRRGKVTPEGTVALPMIGSTPAQGLTLEELGLEINARIAARVQGLEVTPVLVTRAPRYVFVQGEVKNPGRYPLDGPTTVMQSIAIAGGWNVGANIEQVVIFRRTEDWQLVATMLDLRQALLGFRSAPVGEIWISDADLVIVPKTKLMLADNFINMFFTKGLYAMLPFSTVMSYNSLSYLNGIPGTAAAAVTPK